MGRIALPFGDGRITHPYDKPSFSYTQRFGLNRKATIANKLVTGWLFNEGGGNTVYDISGRTNKGPISGNPIWINDQRGIYLDFDTAGDYISAPNQDTTGFNFSAAFWAKSSNWVSGGCPISIGNDPTDGVPTMVVQGGTNSVRLYHRDAWTATYGLTANQWYFFTVVFDNTDAYLYVNAIQRLTGTIQDGNGNKNNYFVGIGFSGGGGSFGGSIDMPIFWNRVLSQSEIAYLYNAQFNFLEHPELTQYQISAVAAVVPPVTPTTKKRDFLSWGQMTSDNMTSRPHKGMGVV